jgi:hypothetical protein
MHKISQYEEFDVNHINPFSEVAYQKPGSFSLF